MLATVQSSAAVAPSRPVKSPLDATTQTVKPFLQTFHREGRDNGFCTCRSPGFPSISNFSIFESRAGFFLSISLQSVADAESRRINHLNCLENHTF